MSAVGLEGLERTVHLTHVWINDLNDRLCWDDKSPAYRLLTAVLHALRDGLGVDEFANLAAQLPGLFRGAYFEQWRPATPVKKRGRREFFDHVERKFRRDPLEDASEGVAAVFELLSKKVTFGEIEDVWHALPEDIRQLWPQSPKDAIATEH